MASGVARRRALRSCGPRSVWRRWWFALQCLGQQEVRQEAFSAGKMGPQSWTPPLPDVLCLTKTLKALNEILEWTDTILP